VNVLGIDTATSATAVALSSGAGVELEARDDPAAGSRPGHTSAALPLAAGLLERAGIGWSELDAIAVGLGPGTFTGLRVGVATARGLAQSLGIEAIGVPSLEALALPALRSRVAGGQPPFVLSVLDARRGEAFLAGYGPPEAAAGRMSIRGGHAESAGNLDGSLEVDAAAPSELLAPAAVRPEQLTGEIAALADRVGVGVGEWLAVGDGAILFAAQLEVAGVEVAPAQSSLHPIAASAICELASAYAGVAGREGELLPLYGRRPDAELTRERRLAEAAGALGETSR
jgi:tRNA threonylcarbamoyladenosine biosynthesis protein TsaB